MTTNRTSSSSRLLIAGCALVALCLVCLLAVGAIVVYFIPIESVPPIGLRQTAPAPTVAASAASPQPQATTPPAAEPTVSSPAPQNPLSGGALPTALARESEPARPQLSFNLPGAIVQEPPPRLGTQHLEALLQADYPAHDYYEASQRLGGLDVGPRTIIAPTYQVGDQQSFYLDDRETEATLLAATEHAYFWVEDSLNLDQAAVEAAALRFEEQYYPRLEQVFGHEWRPGVDNDPHFSVLHLDYMDSETDELGHFNSGDEYPRSFLSGSNQQELVYLNMSNLTLGSDLYFGTLVHEYQHLVQWHLDANETAWLNEGLSQLAEIYVGLETADTIDYLLSPDTRLTTWDYSSEDVYAHYAATYLFCVYLWEQLGEPAIQELARHPTNGIASVDAVLQGFRPDLSLEQFMANWVAANVLDDDAAGEQYAYESLELRSVVPVSTIDFAPHEEVQTLDQFAAHYVDLGIAGTTTLYFAGDTTANFLTTNPHSGNQVWFAPTQDSINAQLTRRFDLTELDRATLSFWTWYDLKFDTDYGYVSVSADDGQTWEVLDIGNGSTGDYGTALNGRSEIQPGATKDGWVQETVALDDYTGGPLLVRFEMLTYFDSDARGWALDDISIPELDFFEDVEDPDEEWLAAGFVPVGAQLPQQWSVQLIHAGQAPEVVPLELDAFNQGQWTVDVGPEGATVAIMPLTPFATEPANYWLSVRQ